MHIFPIVTSEQRIVLGVAIINIICPVFAVSLRILSHRIAHRKLTSSDYCVVVASLFAVALQAIVVASVVISGVGYGHASDINTEYGVEPIYTLFKLLIASDVLWAASLSLSRMSMLLLYSRLFRDTYVVLASRITIFFTVSWAVPTVVINFLICQPISASWTQGEDGGGHCGDRLALFMATAMLNLVSDLIVVVLPLPHLYRLALPRDTKLGLAIVMSLGILTCIVSLLRLLYMHRLDFDDITWTLPIVSVSSGIEPSMAATLCCIPLLKPLLRLGKRKRLPSRVKVVRNTLRTQQYDPQQAGKLRERGEKASYTAAVIVDVPTPIGAAASLENIEVDGGDDDLQGGTGPEITVNNHWRATSEPGDWTQILDSR